MHTTYQFIITHHIRIKIQDVLGFGVRFLEMMRHVVTLGVAFLVCAISGHQLIMVVGLGYNLQESLISLWNFTENSIKLSVQKSVHCML